MVPPTRVQNWGKPYIETNTCGLVWNIFLSKNHKTSPNGKPETDVDEILNLPAQQHLWLRQNAPSPQSLGCIIARGHWGCCIKVKRHGMFTSQFAPVYPAKKNCFQCQGVVQKRPKLFQKHSQKENKVFEQFFELVVKGNAFCFCTLLDSVQKWAIDFGLGSSYLGNIPFFPSMSRQSPKYMTKLRPDNFLMTLISLRDWVLCKLLPSRRLLHSNV